MPRMLFVVAFSLPFAAVVRAQESAALFDAPLVTLDEHDRYAFLTDLDADGFEDAVSWWWGNPDRSRVRLRAWRNDGTGKFIVRWATTVYVEPGSGVRVLPCQLDADGDTDICVVGTSTTAASIRAVRSRGLLSPELASEYSITRTGLPVLPEVCARMADFTGDGLADLAYSVNGELNLMAFVPGQPGLVQRSTTYPFGSSTSDIEGMLEIDANGDATPDLLVWRDATVKLIEIEDCQPTVTQTYTSALFDYKPACGDIDGDGDEDLVLFGDTSHVLARRTGPASFAFGAAQTGGPAEFLFDVDADGDLDGVCCGGGGDPETPDNIQLATMRVSLNDGAGRFVPAIERPWLGSDHLAGIADLDHDGDLDAVAGRCILYSRSPLAERPQVFASTQTPRTTADLDGDGDPDFTVGLRTSDRNLGEGATASAVPIFQPPPTGTIFAGPGWPGDYDGDGDVDLVVRHQASGGSFLGHRLLKNMSGGAFADGGPAAPSGVEFNPGVTLGNTPEASLTADADDDGDLDLVTRGLAGTGYRSLLWLNDGAGHFSAGHVFQDESVRWFGDLDGDGITDAAGTTKTCSYCEDVGWHKGLGGGVFGPHRQLSPVDDPNVPFAVADLDGDGDLDFAIAFLFTLNLYWNDGNGVFTAESVSTIRLSNATTAHQVWATDANRDGLPDLLVTGSELEPACVTVLLRRADNAGWRPPFAQVVHSTAYTLDAALCDVDGDGDEDYVTNRIMRNQTFAQPEDGRRRQIGAGSRGTAGLIPTLGATGPFRVGESAELRIRGGLGGAPGVLTVTLLDGRQRGPGGWFAPASDQVLARIPFTLAGQAGIPGAGRWSQTFAVAPEFALQVRRYEAEIADGAASDGLARTNTLVLQFGP